MTSLTLNSVIRLPTGHNMPLLGFGVFQNYKTEPSCLSAFKTGYRHVDSAQMYRNEAEVGEALRKSGLQRGDVFVTTKCASRSHGYEPTLKGVDESLKKFGFDYIDLFLIHDPYSGQAKRLETYRALKDSQALGKIRTVGVSNYGVKHLEEIQNAGLEKPAVNQLEVHPFCQQRPIVEYCNKNGIVIQAYCAILKGQFDHPVIQEIASKYAKDPAQILLRWSLQKGFVPLVKSETPTRIESNTKLYDFELDEGDMKKLDGLDRGKDGSISWNPVDAD